MTVQTLKAVLKRWVLVRVLNWDRLVQSRMCCGSEFQREGAAMEKALSPQVVALTTSHTTSYIYTLFTLIRIYIHHSIFLRVTNRIYT